MFDIPITSKETRFYSDLNCFDHLGIWELDFICPPYRDKTIKKMEGNTEIMETVLYDYKKRRKEVFRKECHQDGSISYSHLIGKRNKKEKLMGDECDHIICFINGEQMEYKVIREDD